MRGVIVFLVFVAAVAALPNNGKIVGGSVTTIDQYPYAVAMLILWPWGAFYQECGGAILNNRSILSAAHCYSNTVPTEWRVRAGSAFASSGGTVYNVASHLLHPTFTRVTFDGDVAIIRTATTIIFSNTVGIVSIAGTNYNVNDNTAVWAIGWGRTSFGGSQSEQLRHVQVWTINREVCRQRYASIRNVNENMICSGWLDVGGRDQCGGDSGGPLLHISGSTHVAIGVCSWGQDCASAIYPGVNARVSSYTSWIQSNS